MNTRLKTVYILGAGFSCYAALPTQQEIIQHLLEHQNLSGPQDINEIITAIIQTFLREVFHLRNIADGAPYLEDIYTCIDLAAQSGHFLGPHYTPKKLQAIRQFLTHRVFQILEKRYQPSQTITNLLTNVLHTEICAFIPLNWDLVLEKHLHKLGYQADYQCSVQPLTNLHVASSSVPVYKLHGSANWAYCDNCKYLFSDSNSQTALHDQLFLFPHDFSLFGYCLQPALFSTIPCPHCKTAHMSTHIVNFSYRKNFRTNYFSCLWHQAEILLQQADRWIFIGYSLPQADFQFKHLLKSAQLALDRPQLPEIAVITKSDGGLPNPSVARYHKFFGSRLQSDNIYHKGIDEYIAKRYGCLSPASV